MYIYIYAYIYIYILCWYPHSRTHANIRWCWLMGRLLLVWGGVYLPYIPLNHHTCCWYSYSRVAHICPCPISDDKEPPYFNNFSWKIAIISPKNHLRFAGASRWVLWSTNCGRPFRHTIIMQTSWNTTRMRLTRPGSFCFWFCPREHPPDAGGESIGKSQQVQVKMTDSWQRKISDDLWFGGNDFFLEGNWWGQSLI